MEQLLQHRSQERLEPFHQMCLHRTQKPWIQKSEQSRRHRLRRLSQMSKKLPLQMTMLELQKLLLLQRELLQMPEQLQRLKAIQMLEENQMQVLLQILWERLALWGC